MRYRWKLLVLLLVIALVPIVTSRWFGVRAVKRLGNEMVSQLAESRIAYIKRQLKMLANHAATLVKEDAQKAEIALLYQAQAVEKALVLDPRPPVGVSRPDIWRDTQRLASLAPVYRILAERFPNTVLRHETLLKNGVVSGSFSAKGEAAAGEHRQRWKLQAVGDGIHWSQPFLDAYTRQMVSAVMISVKRPNGKTAGTTALILPVNLDVFDRLSLQHISIEINMFLVAPEKNPPQDTFQLKILAQRIHTGVITATKTPQPAQVLRLPPEEARRAVMIQDFETGRGNTRRADYQGRDALWVYRALPEGDFLVFVTPYEKILAPTRSAKAFVKKRIVDLVRFTNYGLLISIVVAIFLALAFSRTVTRPIHILLEAALRLGRGDLNATVDIRSRDEFGDLARVFNFVVPQLKRGYQVQKTMAVAVDVQQSLIPKTVPVIAGLDIAGKSVYCEGTGGDYYDFIAGTSETSEKIMLAVGDVSDHGLPSALLMATARAALRQRTNQPGPLSAMVTDVNRQLSHDVEESGRFMSLFFCEIDAKQSSLTWVRAGHDPALLFDRATQSFATLGGEGLPLGVFEETHYQQMETPVRSGHILIIGTDGIWETRSTQGEPFGKDRLKALVKENAHLPAQAIMDAIFEAVRQFRHPLKPDDDVTLVVAKIETGGPAGEIDAVKTV